MNVTDFFTELKRRNVYRVAVAYAVIGWLLIQIATQVFPFFEIPNWAIRLTIVLLILGFPVALVLSWAFEITPEGIKRAEDVLPNESITKKTGRKLVGVTGVLALIAAGWFVFQLFRTSLTGDSAAELNAKGLRKISEQSVAVIPLVNSGGDPNNEYFSDGMSEELISVLTQIPGLKVIGRNSSFVFKGSAGDSASIGQKLGVAQLLQGSVLRQGDRVRIIAEMIRASDGQALWSETYEREVKDVFAIQSEIAHAVAVQLKIKLLGEKPVSDSTRSSPNPSAHDALLQSRFYFNQGNNDGWRKAINYAEEATRLDPNYAEAWARLSIAMRNYGVSGAVSDAGDETEQALAGARVAADKAYTLDSQSVDALMAMQGVAMFPGFDFASAERYGRRARELAPGNVTALLSLSSALIAEGKLEEADPLLREVTAADPLQFVSAHLQGLVMIGLRRYKEAREVFNKILELHPKAARAHTQLAILDVLDNNPQGALEHAHLEQEGFFRDFSVAMALQARDDNSTRDAALRALIDKQGKDNHCWVAMLYAQRHEPDEMFKWLETAYANRDVALSRIFIVPFLMDYRDDPRFATFCRKLGIESPPPKL